MQGNDIFGSIYAAARLKARLTAHAERHRFTPIASARLWLVRRHLDALFADARTLGVYDRALNVECDAHEDERSATASGGVQ